MVIQRFRPDFGGQGVQVEQRCQALARRGVRSVVLCATRGRPSELEVVDGYRVHRLRSDLLPGSASRTRLWMPTFGARVLLELLRLDRVDPIDVVHVHGGHDGLYGAALFCRRRRVPLVVEMTLMGDDDPASMLAARRRFSKARRRLFRGADAYVAMSRAFLPSYESAGLPPERLRVIPQGVDTRRFAPATPDVRRGLRAALGVDPDGPLVVFVGSLIERKGIDVLLAAWSDIHERRPDATLLLAGRHDFPPGSDESRFLETTWSALSGPARQRVRRTGLTDTPERCLAAADVFAFPTRREGFGSVIIEAMACGLPAVVARLEGITDFVFSAPLGGDDRRPPSDGIVVPQDDPHALAHAVFELLADPARARAIGEAAAARARAAFDLDAVVAPAHEALYERLVRQRRDA